MCTLGFISILAIFQTLCQGADSDNEDDVVNDDDDDEMVSKCIVAVSDGCHLVSSLQAELDATLIESAGDLIAPLIKASGSAITMAEINPFVKSLLGKLVGSNKMCDV